MTPRAAIVVTGTEVLTGRVQDRNGPWVADRLLELGVDLAHITICGDRPDDMEAQLRFLAEQGVDLIVTTGGLGPTADDLTVQVVARFTGRPLVFDEEMFEKIKAILQPLLERWRHLDPDAIYASNRKQAMVPEGATVIDPAGTAPGVVVPPLDGTGPTVVVLPGPPGELQAMWQAAAATDAFAAAIAGRTAYEQHTLRLFGIPESEIAETLRVAERQIDGLGALEVTTCLRHGGELEVVVRHEEGAAPVWAALSGLIADRHARTLFSTDGSHIDDQVAEVLGGRRLGVAESCTGGLMAGRISRRPGASEYFAGGVVAYSDEAKSALLGVEADLIRRHGAVSPEVAGAMADGALDRFDADVGIAITGIAGPGGGTGEKAVGYVCWCAKRSDGAVLARDITLPGDRDQIRDRATTVGMHLIRRLLRGEKFPL